jgi:hypothetical protein
MKHPRKGHQKTDPNDRRKKDLTIFFRKIHRVMIDPPSEQHPFKRKKYCNQKNRLG